MSQHTCTVFHQGLPVTILMGWDRPLQGFFMDIQWLEGSDDEDDDHYLYSNLDDPALDRFAGLPPDLEHFICILRALGLVIPAQMLLELRCDQLDNVGNRWVCHDAVGHGENGT